MMDIILAALVAWLIVAALGAWLGLFALCAIGLLGAVIMGLALGQIALAKLLIHYDT